MFRVTGKIATFLLLAIIVISVIGCGGSGGTGSLKPGDGRTNADPPITEGIWLKGNIHSHTTRSDGHSSPVDAARWYESHGYDFLAITDHNSLTDPQEIQSNLTSMLLIPGEEVTAASTPAVYHINGIGISRVVNAATAGTLAEKIQSCVSGITAAGGIAIWNHGYFPGFGSDYAMMSQIDGLTMIEVYNAAIHAEYDPNITGDALWDNLLSSGKFVYGIGSDDTHDYVNLSPYLFNPGRAWIMVYVQERSTQAILDAMRTGNFYATTGIELDKIAYSGHIFSFTIKPKDGVTYYTEFIGLHGVVLQKVDGTTPSYIMTGSPNEAYVRAKVTASNGKHAWTQPVRP